MTNKFGKLTLSALLASSLVLGISINCLAATTSTRLGGGDRYSTSAIICNNGWNTSSDYAVIASGENFPDALSATPLAKKYNAPMLLTASNSLSTEVKEQLQVLNVKNVFIVGGTGVVSSAVQSEIESMGINVTRLAGKDRFDTNLKVAQELGNFNEVAVVNGYGFPDALSIAPIAAQKGMPILLSDVNKIPDSINNLIQSKNIIKSYVIGGTGVLNPAVQESLPNAERLSGPSRYETNASIINRFSSELDLSQIYLANGENFPDALSGSALAAKNNAPIVLTEKDSVSSSIINFVKNKNIESTVILGGTGVVSKNVENVVTDTINSTEVPIAIEQLPINITIKSPDSIGNVYMDASYKNNSQKNIVGYSVTVLLKDTNEVTYLSNYNTVLPGETSPSFETFGPKTQNKDDIQILKYEITIANNDGSETDITYDCKLKTYDISRYQTTDITNTPSLTIDQLPMDITIKDPDSIGNVYMDATYKNNSQRNIVGYSATVLLKDTNEITYLSNYDTVLSGEASPSFETFGPKTQNRDDVQVLGYEITIANADGSKTILTYDNKLKRYKQIVINY